VLGVHSVPISRPRTDRQTSGCRRRWWWCREGTRWRALGLVSTPLLVKNKKGPFGWVGQATDHGRERSVDGRPEKWTDGFPASFEGRGSPALAPGSFKKGAGIGIPPAKGRETARPHSIGEKGIHRLRCDPFRRPGVGVVHRGLRGGYRWHEERRARRCRPEDAAMATTWPGERELFFFLFFFGFFGCFFFFFSFFFFLRRGCAVASRCVVFQLGEPAAVKARRAGRPPRRRSGNRMR